MQPRPNNLTRSTKAGPLTEKGHIMKEAEKDIIRKETLKDPSTKKGETYLKIEKEGHITTIMMATFLKTKEEINTYRIMQAGAVLHTEEEESVKEIETNWKI